MVINRKIDLLNYIKFDAFFEKLSFSIKWLLRQNFIYLKLKFQGFCKYCTQANYCKKTIDNLIIITAFKINTKKFDIIYKSFVMDIFWEVLSRMKLINPRMKRKN